MRVSGFPCHLPLTRLEKTSALWGAFRRVLGPTAPIECKDLEQRDSSTQQVGETRFPEAHGLVSPSIEPIRVLVRHAQEICEHAQ